jgi:hypothetical protein
MCSVTCREFRWHHPRHKRPRSRRPESTPPVKRDDEFDSSAFYSIALSRVETTGHNSWRYCRSFRIDASSVVDDAVLPERCDRHDYSLHAKITPNAGDDSFLCTAYCGGIPGGGYTPRRIHPHQLTPYSISSLAS